MKKIAKIISIIVLLLIMGAGVVQAADLTLTKIGTMSTTGVDYSIVDYVGGIPALEGTATPGAQISVKIKTVTGFATTASPSGIWQYIPTSLDNGSNSVLITSGTQTISFILSFNATTPTATPTATITSTPIAELPQSGVWENMALVIMAGIGVIFLGGYIREKMIVWEGKKR